MFDDKQAAYSEMWNALDKGSGHEIRQWEKQMDAMSTTTVNIADHESALATAFSDGYYLASRRYNGRMTWIFVAGIALGMIVAGLIVGATVYL